MVLETGDLHPQGIGGHGHPSASDKVYYLEYDRCWVGRWWSSFNIIMHPICTQRDDSKMCVSNDDSNPGFGDLLMPNDNIEAELGPTSKDARAVAPASRSLSDHEEPRALDRSTQGKRTSCGSGQQTC